MSDGNVSVVKSNGRGRPRVYPYPSKLVCSVTGKVVLTNPMQMQAQLKKSGKTLEEYVKTYVCRAARKTAGLNKPPASKVAKKKVVCEDEPIETPDVTSDCVDPIDNADIVEIPVDENKTWGDIENSDDSVKKN